MKKYLFKTTATMKEYNNKKWWIDSNVVRDKYINAENLNEALEKYKNLVEEKDYISISNNAIKNKNPMYVDTTDGNTKQVGYVITAKTEFQDDNYTWSTQYIDLWVSILTIEETEFQAIKITIHSLDGGEVKPSF